MKDNIFLKNIEREIERNSFRDIGINNVEHSMRIAVVDNNYAKELFGEKLYKELNWNILNDEEKTLIASMLVQEIRDKHYYGIYIESVDREIIGEESINKPVFTFSNREDAETCYDDVLKSDIKYLITEKDNTFFSIKEKAPYHIENNEIKLQKLDLLLNYEQLTVGQQEDLLHSCFNEFAKTDKSKEDLCIGKWKLEKDWKKTKSLNMVNDYDLLSEENIINNFLELKKEKEKLDIRYKHLENDFNEKYLNKKYVWDKEVDDIRHESLMLEVEYQNLYSKALILKEDFYSYVWSRKKVDGLEYGESNDYTDKYSELHEFWDELKRIHPSLFVYGNMGVKYAKEDKRDVWWLPAYKISNKISEIFTRRIEENEQNNIVVIAKNAELNKYKDIIQNENTSHEDFIFESELWIKRNALNNKDLRLETIFETVKNSGKDPYTFAKDVRPQLFKDIFEVDRDEYMTFVEEKKEYSRIYNDISANKVFFDEENKIIVYTELGERGVNVTACNMQGYLNKLANERGENAPYNTGLIKTFEFNTDGSFEKVKITEYVNWKSGYREEKKGDFTLTSKYDLVSGTNFKEMDIHDFSAYIKTELDILKTEDKIKTANHEFEIKTQIGNIKTTLGTKNEVRATSGRIDGTYKNDKEDLEIKVSAAGPSIDLSNYEIQKYSVQATANDVGIKIKDGKPSFIHDGLKNIKGADGELVHNALSIKDAIDKYSNEDNEETQTYCR